MADDNVDFRFLGQQVKNLQADMRDMRSGHLRLESDVVGMRADFTRVEGQLGELADQVQGLDQKVDAHNQANQAQFAQQAQTAATNLQLVLSAISCLQQTVVQLDAKVDDIKRDR